MQFVAHSIPLSFTQSCRLSLRNPTPPRLMPWATQFCNVCRIGAILQNCYCYSSSCEHDCNRWGHRTTVSTSHLAVGILTSHPGPWLQRTCSIALVSRLLSKLCQWLWDHLKNSRWMSLLTSSLGILVPESSGLGPLPPSTAFECACNKYKDSFWALNLDHWHHLDHRHLVFSVFVGICLGWDKRWP